MKKILLLGGSAQQVVAIEVARKMGYYTVLCDFLTDNPGQYIADKFYLISTTDKDAIFEVAKKEKIDGVLAYASDPAAPTAAFVAEKMGLKTNPYTSVEILCNKDKFRGFLAENGFNTPLAKGYTSANDVIKDIHNYSFPIIIKPVDSSGSKGATVLHDISNLDKAIDFAFSFSRCHRIIVEEFIEKKHRYLIGGDIFIIEGKVVLWGLMNCHRDRAVNPLVPVGKSYPLGLDESTVLLVKNTLQDLVSKLEIMNGAMNVELIVDNNDRVWPIDIGPRSGGNMIPDLLGYIFNVNVVEMSVKVAMNEKITCYISNEQPFYATHNLHTDSNGTFKDIIFSPELEPYIIKKCIYKKEGDIIQYFDNAAKAIGIIFMKFDSENEMHTILDKITNLINIVMEQG